MGRHGKNFEQAPQRAHEISLDDVAINNKEIDDQGVHNDLPAGMLVYENRPAFNNKGKLKLLPVATGFIDDNHRVRPLPFHAPKALPYEVAARAAQAREHMATTAAARVAAENETIAHQGVPDNMLSTTALRVFTASQDRDPSLAAARQRIRKEHLTRRTAARQAANFTRAIHGRKAGASDAEIIARVAAARQQVGLEELAAIANQQAERKLAAMQETERMASRKSVIGRFAVRALETAAFVGSMMRSRPDTVVKSRTRRLQRTGRHARHAAS